MIHDDMNSIGAGKKSVIINVHRLIEATKRKLGALFRKGKPF